MLSNAIQTPIFSAFANRMTTTSINVRPMRRWGALLLAAAAAGVGVAMLALWRYEPRARALASRPSATPLPPAHLQFVDVTMHAGIRFRYNNGAFGLKLFPENMGGGAAFFDYDNDGDQDLFLAQGRDWTASEIAAYRDGSAGKQIRQHGFKMPDPPPPRRTTGILYRNDGGVFSDVTRQVGLNVEMYGLGAAPADYDNDGLVDLYLTGYGRNYLFRNRGAKFEDVSARAGVRGRGLSTAAAWFDYNRDGHLDLFVGHYSRWTPATDVWHSLDGRAKSYSAPDYYVSDSPQLYRNRGDGTFEDASRRAGIEATLPRKPGDKPRALLGKTLGVALCDTNRDGWLDLIVANDGTPNWLFVNNKNGGFEERGVVAGIAYGQSSSPRSGMGVDASDVDGTGRDSVIIGYYSGQMLGLYRDRGDMTYSDVASQTGVGSPSHPFLTFGALFADVDNDSWADILTANGHVLDDIELDRPDLLYRQRPQLFLNRDRGRKFDEIGLRVGRDFQKRVVGRGLAVADFDLDGDVDVLLCDNLGSPLLLRNDPRHANRSLRLILRGTRGNRDSIGAQVVARVGGHHIHRMVRSGSSYLSQSELPLTLGLGRASRIDTLTIYWPSGGTTTLHGLSSGYAYTIIEGTKGARGVRRKKLRTP